MSSLHMADGAEVARVAADVDRMSGGRLILGLGIEDQEFSRLALTYDALQGHEECTGDPFFNVDPNTFQIECHGDKGGAYINGVDLKHGYAGTPETLHPTPCGHLVEGTKAADAYGTQEYADSFALQVGESHETSISSGPADDRLTVTAKWSSGRVEAELTDQNGTVYSPLQSGPVYSTWTIQNPGPTTWTLKTTLSDPFELGHVVTFVTAHGSAIPESPPAGDPREVRLFVNHQGDQTVTLRALSTCSGSTSPGGGERLASSW